MHAPEARQMTEGVFHVFHDLIEALSNSWMQPVLHMLQVIAVALVSPGVHHPDRVGPSGHLGTIGIRAHIRQRSELDAGIEIYPIGVEHVRHMVFMQGRTRESSAMGKGMNGVLYSVYWMHPMIWQFCPLKRRYCT